MSGLNSRALEAIAAAKAELDKSNAYIRDRFYQASTAEDYDSADEVADAVRGHLADVLARLLGALYEECPELGSR